MLLRMYVPPFAHPHLPRWLLPVPPSYDARAVWPSAGGAGNGTRAPRRTGTTTPDRRPSGASRTAPTAGERRSAAARPVSARGHAGGGVCRARIGIWLVTVVTCTGVRTDVFVVCLCRQAGCGGLYGTGLTCLLCVGWTRSVVVCMVQD